MPKKDQVRRIDQRPTGSGGSYVSGVWVQNGETFDDRHLLARNGSRSLLAVARWLWDVGSEVAGVFRSHGTGAVEVFGRLYAGRDKGPRAGIAEYRDEQNRISAAIESAGSDNIPVFSTGAPDSSNPNDAWLNIGPEGYPRIYLGFKGGYARKIPVVPMELLDGSIQPAQIDRDALASDLQIPVVESLEGLSFSEGQLFELRAGSDSGVLYMWTRWGPEPVGGYHEAGPHDHSTFAQGDQLHIATALIDVSIIGPVANDVLVYDAVSEEWVNTQAAAATVYLTDVWGYFGTDNVEAGMEYLATHAVGGGAALTVKEADGSPSVAAVTEIRVTNGTLTDVGSGVVSLDFGSAATDGSAIHENVASEIHAITEKVSPIAADELVIEDSADSYNKKRVQIGNLPVSGDVATDAIFDAKGDLPVGTGANTAAKLAAGTNTYKLTANSAEATGLKWVADLKISRAHADAVQSVSTSPVRLRFDTVDQDEDSAITTGASWVFTAPRDGYYIFRCAVGYKAAVEFFLRWMLNGSQTGLDVQQPSTGGTWNSSKATLMRKLSAGDTLYINASAASGTANTFEGWSEFEALYSGV